MNLINPKFLFVNWVNLAIFACALNAQQYVQITEIATPEFIHYRWDSIPRLHELTPSEMRSGMVIILDKRIIEYFNAKDSTVMYYTKHEIIRVNSEKAIEEANTVYLPVSEGSSLVSVQARAITKEGKITLLNPSDIKDVANFQNHGHYKIFAIGGIESGGEVEYLYTMKNPSKKLGTEYVRTNALHKQLRVDIYSPSFLFFDAKSYNGFPEVKTDTSLSVKHHIYCIGKDIEGYDKETYSEDNGALMRLEYKFAGNFLVNPYQRIDTWNDYASKLYDVLEKDINKKDSKCVHSILDTMKLDGLNEESKIRKIESRLKGLVTLKEDVNDNESGSLAAIIKNHAANETGILKLYDQVFDAASIRHYFVATTDRFDKSFDEKFDSWIYIQKFLIFFPGTGNFIAPAETFSRYGFPPADWICQKGLYIIPGDKNNGTAQVNDIPCNDWKQSMTGIFANARFDSNMSSTLLHFKQTLTGYEAYPIQAQWSYLSDVDKKDISERVFKYYFPDCTPENINVSGFSENDLYRTPFTMEADITTSSLLEKAGDKYLFKIGALIGPQDEMYNDTVRHTPIENHYNKGYRRELSFVIPAGYRVTNLDSAVMDVFYEAGGERTMEFHSAYKTEGNKITVIVDENYRQLRYPVSMYQQFRRVINASADFNKVVLVIEKK